MTAAALTSFMTNQIPTSEYLQHQLVDMIELAKTTGTNAVEFVQAQAPDVVRQIISWKLAEAITWSLFLVLLMLICVLTLKHGVKYGRKTDWMCGAEVPLIGGPIVVGALSMWWLIQYSLIIVKITVAPKLFLIEYTASLFKH